MAYCRECGKELGHNAKTCLNCGFPNPDWVELDEEIVEVEITQRASGNNDPEDQYALDTEEVIEGSYIMPGAPGYVAVEGYKVIGNDANDFKREKEEFSVGKKTYDEPVIFEEPISVKDDTYEETEVFEDESFEDTIQIEEGVVGGYIPPIEDVEEIPQQDTYTPPTSQQGGYVPPTPPPSGDNYGGSDTPKGKLPMGALIGIGVAILAVIAFMFLRGGGGGNKGGADPLIGRWNIALFGMGEELFDVKESEDFEGIYLMFKDDKKLEYAFEDLEEGTWEKSGEKIKVDLGDGEVYDAILEDGVLDVDFIEIRYYFTKEGSQDSEKLKKLMAGAIKLDTDEEFEPEEDIDYAEENVNEDYWIGDWVGYYEERYSWGQYETDEDMTMDVYGYIGIEESTQKPYLEVYEAGLEDPFISLYVDLEDTHINGAIGEDDAWVGNRFLTEDDSIYFWYLGEGDPPTIEIRYQYVDPEDEDSGIEFTIMMRKDGVSWDDMDKKPSTVD